MWHGCYWSSKLCRSAPLTGPGSLKRRQPRLPKHNISSQHLSDFPHFLHTSSASLSPIRSFLPPTLQLGYIRPHRHLELQSRCVQFEAQSLWKLLAIFFLGEVGKEQQQQHRLAIGNEDYDYGNSRTRQYIQPLRPADNL